MKPLSLRHRSSEPELMDHPDISYLEMKRCLRELEFINRLSLSYRPVLNWLETMKSESGQHFKKPLRILDVACGGGDMLRKIDSWARQQGLAVELTGIDLNHHTIDIARRKTPSDTSITYLSENIFNLKASDSFHFIITSLFTHHLSCPEIIRLLQWIDSNAVCGWFINDLHRHWLAYYFVQVMVKLLPVGPLVCNDAPISVARSFTHGEWCELLDKAGIAEDSAAVQWYFPFRYGVSCRKY